MRRVWSRDYHEHLRESVTGLDLIEQERLAACSILVTSRHEEAQVLERAAKLELKILPKSMVGLIPITFRKPNLQDATKNRDGIGNLLRVDEGKPHRLSLAKKVAAFFKICRSIAAAPVSQTD